MTTHDLANLLETLQRGMESCMTVAARKEFAEAAENLRAAPETPLKKLADELAHKPAKQTRQSRTTGADSNNENQITQAANWYLNVRERILRGESVSLDYELNIANKFPQKVLEKAFENIDLNFKAKKKGDLISMVRNTLKGLQLDHMRGEVIRAM